MHFSLNFTLYKTPNSTTIITTHHLHKSTTKSFSVRKKMQQEREMMRGSSNNSVLPQQQHQPPQAQKCPRCDSQQTKFCYYNNYSLSQPRHFCKACKRYWTHGGTLRNIPIGGGCRKGKRAKAVVLDAIPPQAPPAMMVSPTVQVRPSAEPVVQFPYYQSGGGYYSTLSGMNHAHPVMNHQIGGEYRSMNSNVGLLQGFTLPGYGSQQLYQMGTINESSKNMMIQPTRTLDQEWSLLNPSTSSDGGVSWDTTGGSSGAAETGNALASLTFCPSPWNDHLSRYDPPNW